MTTDHYKSYVNTKKINNGQWHLVVLYQTGGTTDDIYGLYVDGVLKDSAIVPRVKEDMAMIRFGEFKGEIEQPTIFPWALSKGEVKTIYAAGPDGEAVKELRINRTQQSSSVP